MKKNEKNDEIGEEKIGENLPYSEEKFSMKMKLSRRHPLTPAAAGDGLSAVSSEASRGLGSD